MLRSAFCVSLALMFAPAMGSTQDVDAGLAAYTAGDYATALREWVPLAEQGVAAAQYNLGVMYHLGAGVPLDYAEAKAWYLKAVQQGNAAAQRNLGALYYRGDGVPQDYAEAVAWFRKAAEQGDALAQLSLGFMFEDGKGVPQDYVSAHMWFNLSTGNGNEGSTFERDRLAAKMTPADISQAQRRASVCLASNYQDCG